MFGMINPKNGIIPTVRTTTAVMAATITRPILTTCLYFKPRFLENSSPIPAIVNLLANMYATINKGILI
jgi:hypothetical protein